MARKNMNPALDEELYKKIQMLALMLDKRANDLIEKGMRYVLEKYGDPKQKMSDLREGNPLPRPTLAFIPIAEARGLLARVQ